MLSAPLIAAANSGVSFPWPSIDRRIVCFRSASIPQATDAGFDLADLLFIQPAGLVLAIAGDERDRVAGVQQTDDAFDLHQRQARRCGPRSQDRW